MGNQPATKIGASHADSGGKKLESWNRRVLENKPNTEGSRV